jgi:hypothetical protein
MYIIKLITNTDAKILGYKEDKIEAEEFSKIKTKELSKFLKGKDWGIKIVSA